MLSAPGSTEPWHPEIAHAAPQDRTIAELLRRSGRPVVLAVNKAEGLEPELIQELEFKGEDGLVARRLKGQGIQHAFEQFVNLRQWRFRLGSPINERRAIGSLLQVT